MNKIRHVLLIGALALLSATSHAATVVLQNHSSIVNVGDEFLIDVVLLDAFEGDFSGDELLTFGFDLSYDNAAFSLTSKTVGAVWADDTPFLDVDLAGSAFPGIADDGSSSAILLGQLSFSALSAGSFTLGVTGNPAENVNLGLIYAHGEAAFLASAPIDVQAVSAVPIPAAGWLLGSGLLALFRLRRRH
jgi:hypothetical protein